MRRFTTAGNQIHSVADFIGDGVLKNWNLVPGSFPSFSVTKGSGLIDGFYVSTENDETFGSPDIIPSTTYYVYAKRILGVIGEIGNPSDLLVTSIIDTTAPAIPTSLTCTSPAGNVNVVSEDMTIVLEWDDNVEVDFSFYNIYRSLDGSSFSLLNTSVASSYSDVTVKESTSYWYRVSAVDNSSNESGFATGSATTPLSSVAPLDPSLFDVFASDRALSIVWDHPGDVLTSEINSYRISYSELNTDNSILNTSSFNVSNSTLSTNIDGLTNEVKYTVTLQTVDTNGRVSNGVSKTVIPQLDAAPPDPASLSAMQQGSDTGPNSVKLSLSWLPGGDEYEITENVNYRIYFTAIGVKNNQESSFIETSIDQLTLETEVMPFDDGNVPIPEDSLVTARITTISLDGYESKGSYIRLKTDIYTTTQTLRNVRIYYDVRTIRVEWNNNPDTEQIRIKVEKRDLDADAYEDLVFVSEETVGRIWIYVITQPDLGFAYYVSLTPINENGVEGPTITVSQDTLRSNELDLPERPIYFAGMSHYKTIELSWAEPESDLIQNYRLYRAEGKYLLDFSDYTLIDTLDLGTTNFVDYGLQEDQSYTYYITSIDIFNRESPHLENDYSNVGMIAITTPSYVGKLSSVSNATATVSGFNVELAWEIIIGDSFNSFQILRSIGDLHSFEVIALVDYQLNQIDYSYIDKDVLTQSNTNYYYIIQKVANDTTFSVLATPTQPDNSIYLGSIELGENSFVGVNETGRRNIMNLEDTLGELTASSLLIHRHAGNDNRVAERIDDVWYIRDGVYANRIDLDPSLVVTDWTTKDGKIFTTTEDLFGGSIYSLKVNGLFSEILFDVDEENKRLVFAESIVSINEETGEPTKEINLELTVLGIEEVSNILPSFRFDNFNAQQIGYGRLVNSQIPGLSHDGRLRESIIPKQRQLTRYDNHTFVALADELNSEGITLPDLFGNGMTFFAITDDTYEINTVSNFDSASSGTVYTFQNPNFSTYTQNNITGASVGEVSSEEAYSGNHSYKMTFNFTDSDDGRWVQLTTAGFNPVISLTKKLSVRMMVKSGTFYLGLGIRKSYVADPVIGQDGGTSFSNGQEATIEFVGVTELRPFSADYPEILVPQGKYLVTADSESWQTFEFDIPNENVLPFTGNGNLSTTNGYATLESFSFTIDPDADNPTEEIVVYIDDIIQLTDAMAAGTSQGIQKSHDLGNNWELVRYTDTPVYKFYRPDHNNYLWGISSKNAYFSTDVNNWFELPGTKGVQYIRDITDDDDGDMYISTDRGVYLLRMSGFASFSEFSQTQPISPYSTECFAIWNYDGTIRVSTELGIFETTDKGNTWIETSLQSSPLPLFQVISTSSGMLAFSKNHVFRRLSSESQFLEIADLNYQVSTVEEIWKAQFFNDGVYLSTNDGVYQNQLENMFETSVPITTFDRVFSSIESNDLPAIAYSLDIIGDELFIGCENALYSSDVDNQVTTKRQFLNKEQPTINVDKTQRDIGFTYSAFNGVVSFRESLEPNVRVSVDLLPRQIFDVQYGGWAHSNIESPLVIRYNGEPKWIDFTLSESSVTTFANSAKTMLESVEGILTPYNSDVSEELLNRTYASADMILEGTVNYDATGAVVSTAPLVTKATVAEFLKNYSQVVSRINTNLMTTPLPSASFSIVGTDTTNRADTTLTFYGNLTIDDLPYTNTLSNIISYTDFKNAFESGYLESDLRGRLLMNNLDRDSPEGIAVQNVLDVLNASKETITVNILDAIEESDRFEAESAKGIIVDPATGIVDFTLLNTSTNATERNKFKFVKNDRLKMSILGSVIDTSETMSHETIENDLEAVNSGTDASLAANAHGNLIKSGICLERRHPYGFDVFDVQNIQSRYYPGTRADWYDQINSTIDYNVVVRSDFTTPGRIPFATHWFNEDAYFNQRLWVGTDSDIFEYRIESDGSVEFVRVVSPSGTPAEIRSILVRNNDEIYVIADNEIYLSLDFGNSWSEIITTNLPDDLYQLMLVNNNLVVGTSEGVWWKGDAYDEFTKSTLSFSSLLSDIEKMDAEIAFVSSVFNLESSNFAFMESKLQFFLSQDGTSFVALGKLGRNDVTTVSNLYYYKSLLWVATDKGLHNDGGTILSEKMEFGLQPLLGNLIDSQIQINDIVGSVEETRASQQALYACSFDGKIYQLLNDTWSEFDTELSAIHKILLIEDYDTKYVVAIGYDKIITISIATFADSDEIDPSQIEPCLD